MARAMTRAMTLAMAWAAGLAAGLVLMTGAAPAQTTDHLLSGDDLVQVSTHVWMIRGGPNVAIVVGERGILVVDTGLGTRNGEIVSQTALRLSSRGQKLYLTTTHYHAEHATGDGGFPPGTTLIRPRVQQRELEAEGRTLIDIFRSRSAQDRELLAELKPRKPDILFDKDYTLDLGGVRVDMHWFGPAHTRGDELVMVAPDRVLISGDVVQNRAGPYFYCAACTPKSWLAVLDEVEKLDPNTIIPDHSPPGDAALIAAQRAILRDIQTRTAALKAEGRSLAEAKRLLAEELAAKYNGWTGMNHLQDGIERAYASD